MAMVKVAIPHSMKNDWQARLKLTDAVNVVKKKIEIHLAAAKKAAMNFMAGPSRNVFNHNSEK